MLPIRIAVGDVSLDGELNDTNCARALARVLPVTAEFDVWGDELHFDVALDDVAGGRPDAKVNVGDLGLWVDGGRVCLFFGPTPMSPAEDPVSAVPVTIVGRLQETEKLRAHKHAGELTLSSPDGRSGGQDG